MDFRKLALGLLFLSSSCFAATWERPAGAYTPTNNSANITKYQTDSSNHVAISSVKVDGDFNKAFQALNDIEARTAPSVIGKTGLFLSNDGASSYWAAVTPTSIGFQAPDIFNVSGAPVSTSGTISVTLNSQVSNTFLAGPLSGSSSVPAFRSISSTDLPFLVSNGVVTADVSASHVSATTGIALRGFVQSADISITAAGFTNVVHGCGAIPRFVWVELVNVVAQGGFTPGMVAQIPPYTGFGSNLNYVVASDKTSTTLRLGSNSGAIGVLDLTSGISAPFTNANWAVHLKTAC